MKMETETAAQSLLSLSTPKSRPPPIDTTNPQHKLPPPSSLYLPPHHKKQLEFLTSPTTPTTITPFTAPTPTSQQSIPAPILPPITPHKTSPPLQQNVIKYRASHTPFKLPPIECITPPYSPNQYSGYSGHNNHVFTSRPSGAEQIVSAAFTLRGGEGGGGGGGKHDMYVKRKLDFSGGVLEGRVEKNSSSEGSCCSGSASIGGGMKKDENVKKNIVNKMEQQVVVRAYKKVYANATPSSYCHVCSRTRKSVRFAECALIKQGLCRKVICDKCFKTFGWDWEFAMGGNWICVHCRDLCPKRAQCHIYKKINSRRGSKKVKAKVERGKMVENNDGKENVKEDGGCNDRNCSDGSCGMGGGNVGHPLPSMKYGIYYGAQNNVMVNGHVGNQGAYAPPPPPPPPYPVAYRQVQTVIPPISTLMPPRHLVH